MGMEIVEDLKKLIAAEKVIMGADGALKMLRRGKLQKVFLASDCEESVKESIERYCRLGSVEYVVIAQSSEEIGVLCRKPFAVSIVGVLA